MILSSDPGQIVELLSKLEAHAALTQAVAAVASTLIAAGALIYALRRLHLEHHNGARKFPLVLWGS
jgi:alpha-D-ribose 1-methylphosphonate 5-triphosphate synthase subunit PhnH